MKRAAAAGLLAMAMIVAWGSSAFASAANTTPPPPPPPGGGTIGGGPPPPPTVVPTVAPTQVPAQPVVQVKVDITKVSRGHAVKLDVTAATDDLVTVMIRYPKGKPSIYHQKVGSSGELIKTLKVAKNAPLGRAVVTVTVTGDDGKYTKAFSVQITK
jgi:hypothetical protein